MKPTRRLLALLAATLLCPSLRAEEQKPLPPKATDPVTAPEAGESAKKEKPRRPQGAPDRSVPRVKPESRPKEKPEPKHADVAKRTWMGISTQPVDPSLSDHLEIPEGFGIQVVEVSPDSPAAKAGLRTNDIVIRFEDQRLTSPEHLSLLVRSKGNGDKVPLTLIRKGREESVEITLGEADETLFGPFGDPSGAPHGFPMSPRFGAQDPPHWEEKMRKQQDEILRQQKEWMEKHHPGRPPQGPHAPRFAPDTAPEQGEGKPGGQPPGVSVSPGFPLRVFGTEGVLKIDNEQGELTLTRKNNEHHLIIEDAAGKVVFEGPFDPEKGVEGLPENARKQLETMKLGNLEIRLPDPPAGKPEKTGEPEEGRKKSAEDSGEIL